LKFPDLALDSESLVFGHSVHPLRYGAGLEIGNGYVTPEIKYFPRVEVDIRKEYSTITEEILKRASQIGIQNLQLETELTHAEMKDLSLVSDITGLQKAAIEKYAGEHGMHLGLRVTIPDIRDFGKPKHDEDAFNRMVQAFELASENGADVLSVESLGGKELFNYAILRQDILGISAALGLLAISDMTELWGEIVRVANEHGVIPGGDSACAFGNTAMMMAGGLKDNTIPHCLAAIVRAMTASRSLVAYERGALGPGKDCAYENVVVKAITGYPMSMEGKTAAVAHSSLVGNISAATCDLWSNEQVEQVRLFGGFGPEVFLEILHYDTKVMNKAIEKGQRKVLKELLTESDKYGDPQAYVLSPEVATAIGRTIVDGKDELSRTIASGLTAAELIVSEKRLMLGKAEMRYLGQVRARLTELCDDPRRKVRSL